MVRSDDALTRLKAGIYLPGRSDGYDPSLSHSNGVISEYGVGGRDREDPAGLDHLIDKVF
jgi:hypothetical protein